MQVFIDWFISLAMPVEPYSVIAVEPYRKTISMPWVMSDYSGFYDVVKDMCVRENPGAMNFQTSVMKLVMYATGSGLTSGTLYPISVVKVKTGYKWLQSFLDDYQAVCPMGIDFFTCIAILVCLV